MSDGQRMRPGEADSAAREDSIRRFLEHFDALAMKKDFRLLRDLIDEQAFFRFNDGDHVGRDAIQSAFEATWRSEPTASNTRFHLSDVVVLTADERSASVTYTYHWEGARGDQAFHIRGRGTRVLRHHGAGWCIVHEHLSRFPPPA